MTNRLMTTLAFGALALLTTAAAAFPVQYQGSRADVRSFCDNGGHYLLEGGNFSQCFAGDTDVLCRDDGTCSSPDFDLARAAGYQRFELGDVAALR